MSKQANLEHAVKAWVRADALFRLGRKEWVYQAQSQLDLIEAEQALREAITGERDLRKAGEALGAKLSPVEEAKPSKKKGPVRKGPTRKGPTKKGPRRKT